MAEEQKQAGLVVPEEDKGFSLLNTISNVGPSLKQYGKDVISALTPSNIPKTIQGMGELGRGTIYNVTGYNPPHMGEPMPDWAITPVQKMQARRMGYGEDPAQVQREKEVAGMMGERVLPVFKYTREGGYQGFDPEAWKTFGRHVEEDPVGTLSLNAPFLGGAGGTTAKVAGAGSRISEAANLPLVADALNLAKTTGKVIEKGKYLDPTTAALEGVGAVGKGISEAASGLSGVEEFQPIMDLYAKSGREGRNLRDIYKQYSSGQGDYVGLMQDVKDWVKNYRQNKVNEWAAKKQNLANVDIPLNDVLFTTQDQINALGSPQYKFTQGAREAIDFLVGEKDPQTGRTIPGKEGLLERLQQIEALPPGHPEKSLLALDQQKQYLWDLISANRKTNPALAEALVPIHNKLINSLTTYGDSSYGNLMKEFSDIENEMSGINAATGSNMNKLAQFRRMMSSKKNPVGKTYLDIMAEQRPDIGAALLGSSTPSNVLPKGVSGFDLLSIPASAAAYFYHPLAGAAVAGLEGAKLGLGSPALTTGVAKMAGAMERGPIRAGAKSLIEAAPTAAKTVAPFQSSMESAYRERLEKRLEKEAEERVRKLIEGQAKGGRIGRDTGGRTNTSAATKAARLIAQVDHIKKSHSKDTSSLLNLDDDTVAKALSIANQKI